jgi:hypothetical protein
MKVDYSKLPAAWSRIIVDGDPGAGKTTLAKEMATKLGARLISLDDDKYLPGDGRPYLEQLDFKALQGDILKSGPKVIIEGVLALKVLDRIALQHDYHIFMKRLDGCLGWRFGEYSDERVKPPKDPFWREIVQYYKEWKPFDRCNVEVSRDICEQPGSSSADHN